MKSRDKPTPTLEPLALRLPVASVSEWTERELESKIHSLTIVATTVV